MIKNIPFLKYRFVAFALSLVLLITFLFVSYQRGGMNWGIDFVGGVKITVNFPTKITSEEIKNLLDSEGINASVQQIGLEQKNEFVISTKLLEKSSDSNESLNALWTNVLEKSYPGAKKISTETVGPSIGESLKKDAIKLGLIAIAMMMIYLAFRFELKYSFGAVAALIHDVGLAFLFCGFMGIEISVPIIAALLTIFGYSVNDTIVIFDRIRENVESGSAHSFVDIINSGINKSISRTLLTSFTTLLSALALYFLGGQSINDFALVLIFGILVGTYSSVYIASPVVNLWNNLFPAKK